MRKKIKRKIFRISKSFKSVPKRLRIILAFRIAHYINKRDIVPLLEIIEKIDNLSKDITVELVDNYWVYEFAGELKKYVDLVKEALDSKGH